ncbi:hypothetical protein E2320_011774, partial [Naja naja]
CIPSPAITVKMNLPTGTVCHLRSEPNDYRISKRCAPTCDQNFIDTGSSSIATKCCQHSFCNISGAASVKLSNMVLVLGILGSFFYIFQSK